MTDKGIRIFFENFGANLQQLAADDSLDQVRQRAQVMQSQLSFFQEACLGRASEQSRSDRFALNQLLEVKSIESFFDWLLNQQSVFKVENCLYRSEVTSWRVIRGDQLPPLTSKPVEWLEKGVFGKKELEGRLYIHFFAAGELRMIISEKRKLNSQSHLFFKLVANVFPRLTSQLGSVSKQKVHSPEMIAEDEGSLKLLDSLKKAAATDVTILLEGESGTGKEVLANFIHTNSPRRKQSFIAVNCAAIPEGLIESELFGHERGAFTGAVQRHIGKVESADNGTLFLDEIGEMDLKVQAKLLRFIQLKEFHRVGGKEKMTVDVRIIAATNRNLRKAIEEKTFRDDLFFRLSVLPFKIQALKERPGDILPLFHFFLKRYSKQFKMKMPEVASHVLDLLYAHPFPGNIRELENLIQNLLIQSQGAKITRQHFPASFMENVSGFSLDSKPVLLNHDAECQPQETNDGSSNLSLQMGPLSKLPENNEQLKVAKNDILEQAKMIQLQLEKDFLKKIMDESDHSISEASKKSGINRTMLYKMLDRTGLKP